MTTLTGCQRQACLSKESVLVPLRDADPLTTLLLPLLLLQVLVKNTKRVLSGIFCKPSTQTEFNENFDGEEFELYDKYAQVLTTVFCCMLYASGMPILLLVGSIDMFMLYWADKISLLRVYATPPQYDESIAEMAVGIMPYAAWLHLIFGMWVYNHDFLCGTVNNPDGLPTFFDAQGKVVPAGTQGAKLQFQCSALDLAAGIQGAANLANSAASSAADGNANTTAVCPHGDVYGTASSALCVEKTANVTAFAEAKLLLVAKSESVTGITDVIGKKNVLPLFLLLLVLILYKIVKTVAEQSLGKFMALIAKVFCSKKVAPLRNHPTFNEALEIIKSFGLSTYDLKKNPKYTGSMAKAAETSSVNKSSSNMSAQP